MFIIVPAIIIFLCLSYLYLNDTSVIIEIIIYSLIAITIFISAYLYKIIQKDLAQQEKNTIQLEINEILKKLENTDNELIIKSLEHKVEVLKLELNR